METTKLTYRPHQSLQERLSENKLEQLGYTCVTICTDTCTTIRVIPIDEAYLSKHKELLKLEE